MFRVLLLPSGNYFLINWLTPKKNNFNSKGYTWDEWSGSVVCAVPATWLATCGCSLVWWLNERFVWLTPYLLPPTQLPLTLQKWVVIHTTTPLGTLLQHQRKHCPCITYIYHVVCSVIARVSHLAQEAHLQLYSQCCSAWGTRCLVSAHVV